MIQKSNIGAILYVNGLTPRIISIEKRKGQFVLLTLGDGRKVGISPQKPEEFVDALNAKRSLFGGAKPSEMQLPKTSNKTVYVQVLAVIVLYLVFLGYFLTIYPMLPEIVPVHFDINWNPNRWAHKSELFIMAGVAAAFPLINTFLAIKFRKYGRNLIIFLGIIFTLVTALFLVIVSIIYTMA